MFGVLYVIFGIFFSVYFLLNTGIRRTLFNTWILVPPGAFWVFLLIFIIVLVMVVGSFVLVAFGFVLVFRGGVWVARLSGVLCVFLLICYLGVMISPFMVSSGQ